MGFEKLWTVDLLGEYAVIQGMVTTEENDVILVRQTDRGYVLVGLYPPSQTQPDLKRAEIATYFGERVPDAPPELFYCLDFREFTGEPMSPVATPTPEPENKAMILYTSYPGDGGGCMAKYLGYMAPSFVVYADGRLMIKNSYADPYWYSEYQLDQKMISNLLTQIKDTGFFSASGDGSEYEHDSIYQLPPDVEVTHGAGTLSLEVHYDDLSKQVSIYIPYMDYLVPEISKALQVVENYKPDHGINYQPNAWVVWVGTEDPCEPYMFQFKPWPDGITTIAAQVSGKDHAKFVLSNNTEINYSQLLSSKPDTFLYTADGVDYFIYLRPLLPYESPSDFPDSE